MTPQEAFDRAFTGVYTQGKPSTQDDDGGISGFCRYRMGKLRCGIGHLFPNELYNKNMEDRGVVSLIYAWDDDDNLVLCSTPIAQWFQKEFNLPTDVAKYNGIFSLMHKTPALQLLRDLQAAHDDNSGVVPSNFLFTFTNAMRKIAVGYGLNTLVIDKLTNKEPTP